jgi:alkylation response protein AidB-like acyl-CoA dehydrogenase
VSEGVTRDVRAMAAAVAHALEAPGENGRHGLGAAVASLGEYGLLQACLPRECGGCGLGLDLATADATVDVLRRLGRSDLSLARLFEGHVNAAKLIELYACGPVRERLRRRLRAGELFAVWGADADRPVAIDGDRLEGTKTFASGLGVVDVALVTARTDAGAQLVAVDATLPERQQPSAWRASGMEATLSGAYELDGLPAGAEARVGRPDDLFREPYFIGGIWRYCAAQLGGIEQLAEVMRAELVARGRHADPHQGHRLAEAFSLCERGRLWVRAAARRVEAGDDPEAAVAYAVLARLEIEAAAVELVATVERALGTAAFMRDHPADRLRRDLALYVRQANPDGMRYDAAQVLVRRGVGVGDLWRPPA